MNLYGTGVLGAADFKDGEIINTTGYIEIKLPILGNILIPANICKTNMEGLIRYTVTHESGEGSGDDHIEFHIAGKSFEAKSIDDLDFMAPAKKVFNGWKWHKVKGADRIELENKPNTITCNLAAVAQWKKESGGVTAKYYTLKYETNGGTEYKSEDYPEGTKTVLGKVPVKEGYVFTGWYDSEDLDNKISSIDMDSNKTVYAGWKKRTDDTEHNNVDVSAELNVEEHTAYIVGSNDGLIHPNDKITRAEAATIFFRLLKDDIRNKNYIKTNGFNDVYIDNWYNTAISTVANVGIISGYPDGSFRPNAPITRAEFAAICARFDPRETTATTLFADVKGHWAEKEIIRAAENGWVSGYTDGTFKPDVNITRAEAMSLINRVLKRNPETVSDLHGNMLIWADNTDTGKWYYIDVQEATNSHDYIRKENGTESWTEVLKAPDWARLER